LFRKSVSAILLFLLLVSTLTVAFNIQPAKAEGGTIYIRADGSIDPPTAPIQRDGNVYTFTDNIYDPIVVLRSNIIIDGKGYSLQGTTSMGWYGSGIYLCDASNVTIKNTNIKGFENGVTFPEKSSNNTFKNNIISNSIGYGMRIFSSYNNIIDNIFFNNAWGISLENGFNNVIRNNIFEKDGIKIFGGISSCNSHIVENNTVNGRPLYYFKDAKGVRVPKDAGSVILVNCSDAIVEGINVSYGLIGICLLYTENSFVSNNIIDSNSLFGILFDFSNNNKITNNIILNTRLEGITSVYYSQNNIISNNTIISNQIGIRLDYPYNIITNNTINRNERGIFIESNYQSITGNIVSNNTFGIYSCGSGNSIVGNFVSNNTYGIYLLSSSNEIVKRNVIINNKFGIYLAVHAEHNKIYHNDFINNFFKQAYIEGETNNIFDDGYPSGGNYWSDYTDVDLNNDGIWDHPYVIDENNRDRYPLVNPWTPAPPIQEWLYDSDFQYNLDDSYGTVEGTGHLGGVATLSAGTLSIGGQITINGPLPSGVPEVYLIATDGQDKELAKQAVDLSGFSYWQTATNTYNFTGQIPNVIQPINNGHYEASALITYNTAKYEFFVNTASLINNHYLPLTTPPTPTYIQGIDVSHYQGDISWSEVYGAGYRFAFVKASEGVGWIDPNFVTNMDNGSDAGLLMGAYHFARPDLGNDAQDEALCFVSVARNYLKGGYLRPALDLEVGSSLGKEALSNWVHEWMETVKNETGIEPIIYVSSNYANNYLDNSVAKYDLWIAHWTYDPATSPNTGIWNSWDFWQYSNNGSVPGISGDVDLDLFNGDIPRLYGAFVIPENQPPVALFNYYPAEPKAGEQVTFNASSSYDPDGAIVSYEWDWNGDGYYEDFSESPTENFWWIESGEYHVHLRVVDNRGDAANNSTDITVAESTSGRDNVVLAAWYDWIAHPLLYWKHHDAFTKIDEWLRDNDLDGQAELQPLAWLKGTGLEGKIDEADVMRIFDEEINPEAAPGLTYEAFALGKINEEELVHLAFMEQTPKYWIMGAPLFKYALSTAWSLGISITTDGVAALEPLVGTGLNTILLASGTVSVSKTFSEIDKELFILALGSYFRERIYIQKEQKESAELAWEASNARILINMAISPKTEQEREEILEATKEYFEALWQEYNGHARKPDLYGLSEEFRRDNKEILKQLLIQALKEKYTGELLSREIAHVASPVELRVYDSEGRVTGVINGEIREEIPYSVYDDETKTIRIFNTTDSYNYMIIGTSAGTYKLEITSLENGQIVNFIATDIPTSITSIHQYTIDWAALSQGEEGVTVQVDSDGDGVFEHTFTSDSELTQSEYVIATDDVPPQTWHNIGEPKFVVTGATYLTSATPLELIAEDNLGGSGVASTAYRIYNASYDSGWITYTEPFYLTGLSDGTYQIDYNSTDYAGNVELTNTVTVFLDNTPPTTTLTIGEPKYISDTTYVTPDTPFTLEANDNAGSGVYSVAYRIYNGAYDSGWQPYTEPFYLTSLTDGVYTITFNSTDNVGNVENTRCLNVTLVGPDINGDGKVDMTDIAIAGRAFGTVPGDARWNPLADVNLDGKVDLRDIALTAKMFGKHCP